MKLVDIMWIHDCGILFVDATQTYGVTDFSYFIFNRKTTYIYMKCSQNFAFFFLFITNNKKTIHPIHIKCSFTRRNCTRFSHPSPITHSLHSVQSRARATTAFFLPANCKKQESTLFNKKTVWKLQHTPEFSYLQKCLYIIWRF